jgi:ATP-binding cassette subfamily F protein 3
MLHGLGFGDEQFELTVEVLSGGQKGRLGLARLLLEAPDLLLLDEPTNHLDLDGRRWLETFLADEYPGAVVVVSHDRWLLDRVTRRIVEVENGELRTYPGNYHKYLELRRERQLTVARQREKQLDRIRQEEQFIARYKTGQRAKQARGRQSRLDRYKRDELVDRPLEMDVMRLTLPKAPRSGEQVIVAEGISKAYGDNVLFDDVELTVYRGDRIGILGPNGAGKTTLVRALLGELEPDAGTVQLGTRLSVGYYRQSHDHLDLSLTVWQYLQSVIVSLDGAVKASEQQARDLAGAFLFSGGEQDKMLSDLSGGERSRAVLAGLVAGAHNLLVLDEPSNHLDLPAAERLEQALSSAGGYEGTLLLITHDRALLEATCDRLLIFDPPRGVEMFTERYSDWERRAAEAAAKPAARGRSNKRAARDAAAPARPKPARRELERVSLRDLESRIERCESRIAEIDDALVDPAVYADGDRCRALRVERQALVDEKLPLETEWSLRAAAE